MQHGRLSWGRHLDKRLLPQSVRNAHVRNQSYGGEVTLSASSFSTSELRIINLFYFFHHLVCVFSGFVIWMDMELSMLGNENRENGSAPLTVA